MTGRNRTLRRFFRSIALLGCVALGGAGAHAADHTLLIQMEREGKFRVWHAAGETNLSERELLLLEASAAPGGGPAVATGQGPARAYETPAGILIVVADAQRDKTLLLDREACSALKAWHSEGATQLSDDQLAELVVTATPDGGPAIMIGSYRAKAHTTRLGVMVVLWPPLKRRP